MAEYRQKEVRWLFLLTGSFYGEVEIEGETGLNAAFQWGGSLSVGIRLYVLGRREVCFRMEKAMFSVGKVYVFCS